MDANNDLSCMRQVIIFIRMCFIMSKIFDVKVTEILTRNVKIKAESKAEAIATVERLYKTEEIVLDAEDMLYEEPNIEIADEGRGDEYDYDANDILID